jgi:hypothetical protein
MEDYKKIVIRAERGPNGEYTTLDGKLITAPSYCKYVRSIDELSKRERQYLIDNEPRRFSTVILIDKTTDMEIDEKRVIRIILGICIFIALVRLVMEFGEPRQTYPIYIHDTETVSKVERK